MLTVEFPVAQWRGIGARNPKVWGSIPQGDLKFFLRPTNFQPSLVSYFFSDLNFKILIINFHKFALSCRYLQELRE